MTRYDFQEAWEKCSNRLQLNLISLLVNLLDELGQIMASYAIADAIRVILSNV